MQHWIFSWSVSRSGCLAAALSLMLAGCALPGLGSHARGGNCEAKPSACAYLPGERDFAEREAARLNRESAAKLRRSSGR